MFEPGKLKEIVGEPGLRPLKKADPFSLDSLIAWLEKQDPEGRYHYCRAEDGCIWAKFTIQNGGHFDDPANSYILNGSRMSVNLQFDTWQGDLAVTSPHTFGAALSRARALRDAS